jgi:hypothetical protein
MFEVIRVDLDTVYRILTAYRAELERLRACIADADGKE